MRGSARAAALGLGCASVFGLAAAPAEAGVISLSSTVTPFEGIVAGSTQVRVAWSGAVILDPSVQPGVLIDQCASFLPPSGATCTRLVAPQRTASGSVTTTLPAVVGTGGYRCYDAPGDRPCEIRVTDGANVVTSGVRFTSSTK